jgi:hypothetical protein
MDEWVELDLDGNFKVQIPADATPGLQGETSAAVIHLGDAGDVLISNAPLAKAADAGALRVAVAEFLTRVLPTSRFTIEAAEELNPSVLSAQGVGLVGKGRVWLARACARRGDDRFWLLHWTGPKDKTSVVLRIFVTFDPAE